MATGNSTLQLTSDPRFRGQVMALWSVTFTGSTPVGGPVVGVVADSLGPRYGLGKGPCLAASGIGVLALRRTFRTARPVRYGVVRVPRRDDEDFVAGASLRVVPARERLEFGLPDLG